MNYARYRFWLSFGPAARQRYYYTYPVPFPSREEAQDQVRRWLSLEKELSWRMVARVAGARIVRGSRETRVQHFQGV